MYCPSTNFAPWVDRNLRRSKCCPLLNRNPLTSIGLRLAMQRPFSFLVAVLIMAEDPPHAFYKSRLNPSLSVCLVSSPCFGPCTGERAIGPAGVVDLPAVSFSLGLAEGTETG